MMSDNVFGAFVTWVVLFVLIVVLSIMFAPGHDMIINGLNMIYQNFGSARANMGL